jgi:hypothetical protein
MFIFIEEEIKQNKTREKEVDHTDGLPSKEKRVDEENGEKKKELNRNLKRKLKEKKNHIVIYLWGVFIHQIFLLIFIQLLEVDIVQIAICFIASPNEFALVSGLLGVASLHPFIFEYMYCSLMNTLPKNASIYNTVFDYLHGIHDFTTITIFLKYAICSFNLPWRKRPSSKLQGILKLITSKLKIRKFFGYILKVALCR